MNKYLYAVLFALLSGTAVASTPAVPNQVERWWQLPSSKKSLLNQQVVTVFLALVSKLWWECRAGKEPNSLDVGLLVDDLFQRKGGGRDSQAAQLFNKFSLGAPELGYLFDRVEPTDPKKLVVNPYFLECNVIPPLTLSRKVTRLPRNIGWRLQALMAQVKFDSHAQFYKHTTGGVSRKCSLKQAIKELPKIVAGINRQAWRLTHELPVFIAIVEQLEQLDASNSLHRAVMAALLKDIVSIPIEGHVEVSNFCVNAQAQVGLAAYMPASFAGQMYGRLQEYKQTVFKATVLQYVQERQAAITDPLLKQEATRIRQEFGSHFSNYLTGLFQGLIGLSGQNIAAATTRPSEVQLLQVALGYNPAHLNQCCWLQYQAYSVLVAQPAQDRATIEEAIKHEFLASYLACFSSGLIPMLQQHFQRGGMADRRYSDLQAWCEQHGLPASQMHSGSKIPCLRQGHEVKGEVLAGVLVQLHVLERMKGE